MQKEDATSHMNKTELDIFRDIKLAQEGGWVKKLTFAWTLSLCKVDDRFVLE